MTSLYTEKIQVGTVVILVFIHFQDIVDSHDCFLFVLVVFLVLLLLLRPPMPLKPINWELMYMYTRTLLFVACQSSRCQWYILTCKGLSRKGFNCAYAFDMGTNTIWHGKHPRSLHGIKKKPDSKDNVSDAHEPVLKRCGIINTLTIGSREWGGVVLPIFTGA